jgi:N-acyl-D-amino-acid deacylase
MQKTGFVLLLLIGVMAAFPQSAQDVRKLDSVLSVLNNTERFNGTALYAENGKILYKKAFGVDDIRTGRPLQTNSSFNLASVSKQFVAVCILKLAEQGKLGLDDPIKKYIPEIPYDSVTIRNLLTHTSGIPEYFEPYQVYRGTLDTLTNEGLILMLARHHPAPDFSPGTQWRYCNTNYVLLAGLIERVSHQTLPDFFRQWIATPLGLKESYVYHLLMPAVPANHVYGFTRINGKKELFDLINTDGVTGDGNIYSSVEDLYLWEQSLYTDKLLKKETLAEAFQPVKLKNGKTYPYGFGWGIVKENESFSHTGSWQGFKNLICRDITHKRTLIVLSSGTSPDAIQFGRNWFNGDTTPILPVKLITHVRVIDGTGVPAYKASVRIEGNKILEIGDLSPFPGEEEINGGGKVLAPGFIDSHSHIAGSLKEHPEGLADISQGVTTIVSGQDGYGSYIDSIKKDILQIPVSVNIATYTGHTALREQVMGASQLNRPATEEELEKMKQLLSAEMKKGSLGLSTGLEYAGAYFSSRHEVLELAKEAAAENGRYISHIRSEDIALADALDEIIAIGREAKLPVQVSHIKIALKDDWGKSAYILSQLQEARQQGINITADCYPYEYWYSTIKVLFPKTDYTNPVSAQYAVDHTFDPNLSILVRFAPNPTYGWKTISEIAAMRKEKPAQTIMGLIAEADAYQKQHPEATGLEGIMAKSMTDEDVVNFLSWANTNICSDGSDGGHPRGYGSFTRVLGYYTREKKIMGLEKAIQKMTSLSAEHTGLKNRGVIAPGYFADLVLFDPETVKDNADIKNPKALSTGIEKVWVNGVCVYEQQQPTHRYPGLFLRRQAY